MTVTDIRPVTKRKYRVEIEGQLAFILYKGELSRYRIVCGEEIREQDFSEIMNEVLPLRAKRYAMNLLVKMDRTEQEIREKLKKSGYPAEVARKAVDYVKSYGYIDDERYAVHYFERYKDSLSVRQISWKLRQKGVDAGLIEKAAEKAEPDDHEQVIRALVEKRLRNRAEVTEKDIRKLEAYLARRGFYGEEIWKVLKDCRFSAGEKTIE
ncbi:recombination regulator RecX [Ruminococcus sp. OA3]|uniref:regulatory protein RecX n=1 Tax=Ruminococcus sp. OA3 TaxID=2914164 RepID=UPI001F05565F|nr:regulatory protein RecX [Ruminococcus sp. OA3]MCH1983756.1 recombination regulator RecX [Ruminococcus sp. OA3]